MIIIAVFVLLVFFYSLISQRLDRSIITAPIIFSAAGILLVLALPDLRDLEGDRKIFLGLAEVGLVLLLFTDATQINLGVLRGNGNLPIRLLTTGMLLTLLLGAIGALVIFPQFSIWEAGILAAILAPTDAGLGQIIVNSPLVPVRIRQALSVEAGLNDGLSVPFLMFFIALAQAGMEGGRGVLIRFVIEQIGYGSLLGLGVGLIGGWLLGWARQKRWAAGSFQQLGLVALPLLCAIGSKPIGASMFIAAYVAGLAVQAGFKEASAHSVEFTEGWGQLLNLFVFFLFGLLVPRVWTQFHLELLVYGLFSLTLVRMLPVAIALVGTGMSKATAIFMGWFGPRGLASIVLGLVYLEEEAQLPGETTIILAITMTVLISIFAHGLSALPGINFYARKTSRLGAGAPEYQA